MAAHRRAISNHMDHMRVTSNAHAAGPHSSSTERQVTIMVSALIGFEALTARSDAQELKEIIDNYGKCVADTARRYDGMVLKTLERGDRVVVCFGYPKAHDDNAERAMLAVAVLALELSAITGSIPLQAGVGIATGSAIIENLISFEDTPNSSVVLNALKLAERSRQNPDQNTLRLAIDDSTQERLGNLFDDFGPKNSTGLAIRQIAELANVPVERREALYMDLASLVIEFGDWHHVLRDPKLPQHVQDTAKQWLADVSDVGRARLRIRAGALELESAIAKFDDIYGKTARYNFSAPQPIGDALTQVRDLLHEPPPGLMKLLESKRKRGRPPSPAHPHLYNFVCTFLVMVNQEGGKLSFNKNYPTSGSLVQALALFRPHMPPGFFPRSLPTRLLARAQKTARGGDHALEELCKSPGAELAEKLLARAVGNGK
jgi:class 3 adenylate cyclase